MSDDNYIFEIPATFGLRDLRLRIPGKHSLAEDPITRVRRDYLDTFDWRLFRAGNVLEMTSEQGGHRMILRHINNGRILLTQVAQGIPRFSTDCKAPGIKQRLHGIIQNRALQSKVPVISEVHALRLLNAEGKTVARLELRKDHISLPQSTKQISLPSRLYLIPYRGYEKAAKRTRERLASKGGLPPAKEDPMLCALKAVGVEAGAYTSRPDLTLDSAQPVSAAVKGILSKLLRVMQENLPGACDNLDPEFLHDFRRALVRASLLLDRLPEIFPAEPLRRVREELSWLDKVGRPTRQMDVYLLLLDDYKSRLPAALQPYLAPFQEYLKDHKALEHRKLRIALQSPRYGRLIDVWRRLLEYQPEAGVLPDTAFRPVGERSRELIRDSYTALLSQGSEIDDQSSAEALIELHRRSKELGFLLEAFQSLFPAKAMAAVVEPLRPLEANLEEFEDLELQQMRLKKYAQEMKEEQRLVQPCLEAMGLLIKDMAEREISVRETFFKRFGKFSARKARSRFEALFLPNAKPREERA